MPKERLLFDKTEIVAGYVSGKKFVVANLTNENITSVTIEPCKVGLFRNKPGERIIIVSGKIGVPITYYRHDEKKYFDGYVRDLEKFCKDNNVTFYNKIAEAAKNTGAETK